MSNDNEIEKEYKKFTKYSCYYFRILNNIYNFFLSFKTIKWFLKSEGKDNIYEYEWKSFPRLKERLKNQNSTKSITAAVAEMSVFITILSFILFISGVIIGFFIGNILDLPRLGLNFVPVSYRNNVILMLPYLLSIILGLIGIIISFYIVRYFYLFYLTLTSKQYESSINNNFNIAIKTMNSLSEVVKNPETLIFIISDKKSKYGGMSREFDDIRKYMENENLTLRDAIDKKIDNTVSDQLSDFLTDIKNDIDKGVSLKETLSRKVQEIEDKEDRDAENMREFEELISEMYINVSVFPLFLIILYLGFILLNPPDPTTLYLISFVPIILGGLFSFIVWIMSDENTINEKYLDYSFNKIDSTKHVDNNQVLKRDKNILDDEYINKKQIKRIRYINKINKYINKIKKPLELFKRKPSYSSIITVPIAIITIIVLPNTPTLSMEVFEQNPYRYHMFNIGIPIMIITIPMIIFNYLKQRRQNKIFKNLDNFLNRIKISMKQGETLDNSIDSQSISNNYLNDLVDESKNKRKWVQDTIIPLKDLTNKIRISNFTHVMDMVISAREESGDISEVINLGVNKIEREQKSEEESKQSGLLSTVLIILIAIIITAILEGLVRWYFLSTMANAIPQGADLQGVGGGGEINLMRDTFNAVIINYVLNTGLSAGYLAGMFKTKDSLSSLKYGILFYVIFYIASYVFTITFF